MVSEAILGALVGGGAAVTASTVQAWINRRNTTDRIQAQNDRHIGEFYLEKKVDALTNYYTELVRFVEEIRLYKSSAYGNELDEEEWSKEVVKLYNSYHQSLTEAIIYLSDEQHEIINATLDPFREASQHVQDSISQNILELAAGDEWNYDEVIDAFTEARKVVKAEIREGVERLEN